MRLSSVALIAILLPCAALAEPLIDGPSRRGPTFEAVEQAFRARVTDAFPPGTPLPDMVARLTDEGFDILDGYGEIERFGFPCNVVWRVLWRENNGIVTEVDVLHGGVCL